jgi:hypothetical protein
MQIDLPTLALWIVGGLFVAFLIKTKRVGAAIATVAVVLLSWYVVIPELLALRTVEGMWLGKLHQDSLDNTEDNINDMTGTDDEVVARQPAMQRKQYKQREAGMVKADVARNDIKNDKEKKLRALGLERGDFIVPANAGMQDTGKSICGPTTFKAWGKVDLKPEDDYFPNQVPPIGAADPDPNSMWGGFEKSKLVPTARLGALLLKADGVPQSGWRPHPTEPGRFLLTLDAKDCVAVQAGVNDHIADNNGLARHYYGENRGAFQVKILKGDEDETE